MKLHSDRLTVADLYRAAEQARRVFGQDIWVEDAIAQGSRSRSGGITFHCAAQHGRFATNSGQYGSGHDRAASWTAWGYLIAELFRRDPKAIIGTYKNPADFAKQCREMAPYRQRYGDHVDFLKIGGALFYEPTGVSS